VSAEARTNKGDGSEKNKQIINRSKSSSKIYLCLSEASLLSFRGTLTLQEKYKGPTEKTTTSNAKQANTHSEI